MADVEVGREGCEDFAVLVAIAERVWPEDAHAGGAADFGERTTRRDEVEMKNLSSLSPAPVLP